MEGKCNPLGPWDQLPRPQHCHPCFPVSKGQLSSLSRGNLAHSARVTRPTKAALCRLLISIVFALAVSVSSSDSSPPSPRPPYLSFAFGPVHRPLRSQR